MSGANQIFSKIQPDKACWILHSGYVADVSNDDGTAFSHGIFVKHWVKLITRTFCPDKAEAELARVIDRRANVLLAKHTELLPELDDKSETNPFEGDLAYVHAAEEQGWIRVKPLQLPVLDNSVFFETFSPDLKPEVAKVVEAVKESELNVTMLHWGAIENWGFWGQRSIV